MLKISVRKLFSLARQLMRMLVGLPDYRVYVKHMQLHHPDDVIMSEKQFYHNRVDSRYGGGTNKISRCC